MSFFNYPFAFLVAPVLSISPFSISVFIFHWIVLILTPNSYDNASWVIVGESNIKLIMDFWVSVNSAIFSVSSLNLSLLNGKVTLIKLGKNSNENDYEL